MKKTQYIVLQNIHNHYMLCKFYKADCVDMAFSEFVAMQVLRIEIRRIMTFLQAVIKYKY